MIIDFHTHIFPENIAVKTIEHLEQVGNTKAFTDGTLNGLKESMKKSNIDYSVVLPVATKPSQFNSMNKFAKEINGMGGVISFGGIHPDSNNYKEELDQICEMGLKGIKLHPDYQETFVDDVKMIRLIEYAVSLDLIVVVHGGIDIGLPKVVHCTPKRVVNLLKEVDCRKVILAHTGGFGLWDEVEELIVGKDILMDVSYSFGHIKDEQFIRIVRNHGTDKMLFATDSPWGGQKETLDFINSLGFTKEELNKILYLNGAKLLNF